MDATLWLERVLHVGASEPLASVLLLLMVMYVKVETMKLLNGWPIANKCPLVLAAERWRVTEARIFSVEWGAQEASLCGVEAQWEVRGSHLA